MSKTKKQSAALITVLIIISVLSVFAFTLAQTLIGSMFRTTRFTDSLTAKEAANGGIEWGLRVFSNTSCTATVVGTPQTCVLTPCTLDFAAGTCTGVIAPTSRDNSKIYADISGVRIDNLITPGNHAYSGTVYSIGQFGGVYRGLKADINNGVVIGDYTVVTPAPTPPSPPSPSSSPPASPPPPSPSPPPPSPSPSPPSPSPSPVIGRTGRMRVVADFGTQQWNKINCALHWQCVNEIDDTESPTADRIAHSQLDHSTFIDEFQMEDVLLPVATPSVTVRSIDVGTDCSTIGSSAPTMTLSLFMGSSYLAEKSVVCPAAPGGWVTTTFSGLNGSQTDLNNLRVRVTTVTDGSLGGGARHVMAIYTIASYSNQ